MKNQKALIIGASRGLGLALVQEFMKRGWSVTGTARQESGTELHNLAEKSSGQLDVENLDITNPGQLAALKSKLQGQAFDLIFVSAGIANRNGETIADIPTELFVDIMVTNTLSPMRVIETLQDNVAANGIIGIMTSGQGSLTNNIKGGNDVYRASKAALNMVMRSFSVRYMAKHAEENRALLLIAPGWIKTKMGGREATYTIDDAIPRIVDTIVAQSGKPGLQYLDQFGKVVPW